MAEVKGPDDYLPYSPPSVTVHALGSNKRPVGFAAWEDALKKKRKRKKKEGKRA